MLSCLNHLFCRITAIAVFTLIIASAAHAVDWRIEEKTAHHVKLSVDDGTLDIRTTGQDPYFVGRFLAPAGEEDHVLEFEYFCTAGVENFSVIVGPPIGEVTRINLPPLLIAEGWRTYSANLRAPDAEVIVKRPRVLRFDLGVKSDVRIKMRNIRLRPANERELKQLAQAKELRQAKVNRADAIRSYLRTEHKDWIENISVTPKHVMLSIRAAEPDQVEDFSLTEFRPEHEIRSAGAKVPFEVARMRDGHLECTVQRFDNGYDRATSGFRLRKGDSQTARRRAVEIQPNVSDFAKQRFKPTNQKGLTCLTRRGPRSDFVDLGVSAVTINVALDQFLKAQDGPTRERIPVDGAPVFFDRGWFKHLDDGMLFAQENDIVVSATILIRKPKHPNVFSPLVHPEADGGVYAMPDITSTRGATIYAYVLRELAKRYRNHERSPGGITNWIIHNELDFFTQWTNMGPQPRECVTETYYRSMRLVHDIAKQYNPHARVFASMTHHWNVPDDGRWQRLAPKELAEDLQRFSQIEGDFDWGVAYHPYPQSLFAKVAWDDKKPTNDLDTPLITIQNLEVLGQFLEQPEMRDADGKMRPVLLSEQGFHTDSYSKDSLEHQAGSLWWTMKRVRSMPWIESFIYHRWIDHPAEGGLKLGLRTLPSKEHPSGKRKRSWHVYQAIGTDRETEVTQGLPQPAND